MLAACLRMLLGVSKDVRSPEKSYLTPPRIFGGEDMEVARIYLSVISTLSRTLKFIHVKVDAF